MARCIDCSQLFNIPIHYHTMYFISFPTGVLCSTSASCHHTTSTLFHSEKSLILLLEQRIQLFMPHATDGYLFNVRHLGNQLHTIPTTNIQLHEAFEKVHYIITIAVYCHVC